jgi:hypothetical protein
MLIVKTPKLLVLARNYIQLSLPSCLLFAFLPSPSAAFNDSFARAHLAQPFYHQEQEEKLSPERQKSIKPRGSKAAHDTSLHPFIIVSCNLTLACPILMFYAFSRLAFRHIQLSLPSPINYSVCRPRRERPRGWPSALIIAKHGSSKMTSAQWRWWRRCNSWSLGGITRRGRVRNPHKLCAPLRMPRERKALEIYAIASGNWISASFA